MPLIGFVLLTHSRPNQTLRLVRTLVAMFDGPPIAIHHDFGQCQLDPSLFPGCVRFVRPHFATGWGTGETVDATIAGARLLFSDTNAPDWFVLLSGADYPIRPASVILRDLAVGDYDAYLYHRPVDPHATDSWNREMTKRYLRHIQQIWWIDRHFRLRTKTKGIPTWASRPFLPFGPRLRPFAGYNWITANRRAAEWMIHFYDHDRELRRHLWQTPCCDEAYLHCVFGNHPEIRTSTDNKRYADTEDGSAHPTTLRSADIPKLLASGCDFARKFAEDDLVLDQLDEKVGVPRYH